jgi:hypothetical protein
LNVVERNENGKRPRVKESAPRKFAKCVTESHVTTGQLPEI